MLERINEVIRLASRDSAQIPVLARMSEDLIGWDDAQVDQLLHSMTDWGQELRESAEAEDLDPDNFEPDDNFLPSHISGGSVGIDSVFQPLIHQLVVREMRRKLNMHTPPNPAALQKPNLDSLSKPSTGSVSPRISPRGSLTASTWTSGRLRDFETLYQLTPATSELRNHLLRWLGTAGGTAQLNLWAELVCQDPPEHRLGIGLAFAPLMNGQWLPEALWLEELLAKGTSHPQIAPAVFDLMNFFVRSKTLAQHPAESRLGVLVELLGQVVGQLGKIEEGDFPKSLQVRQINQLVSDSVALIVALCDTFALTHCHPAIPKLYQAMQLRHRRVQTEAAAALARLGDPSGKQALIELAQQPIARLRVLAYAEELGFMQDVSLELQGEIAIAESQLAIWLSEPDQMGLAPSNLELVDSRTMFWPSYDEPMPCYLFKYVYGSGPNAHSNIGICGPLTHAFAADLRHLQLDEMYAAFAGWQTIHDEIFQIAPGRAKQIFPQDLKRLEGSLEDEAFEGLKIQTLGSFFGELVLVATALYEGQPGTVIVDSHDSTWFEEGNPDAPIDWRMAYGIWRGKQLLTRFNPNDDEL